MSRGPFIRTFCGRHVHVFDPRPDEIELLDIAHALSNQCRYNGHTNRFYSVAEHAVYVSWSCGQFALEGLLHDAAEAYIGDLVSPIKRDPRASFFKEELEPPMERVIAQRFRLVYPWPAIVHDIDRCMIPAERAQLFPDFGSRDAGYEDCADLKLPEIGLEPVKARALFLHTFDRLMGQR
jgi:hypothetical protein